MDESDGHLAVDLHYNPGLMGSTNSRVVIVLASISLLAGPGLVLGGDADRPFEARLLTDAGTLRLGVVHTAFQTDISAGSVLGALIRLEEVLGYEESIESASLSGMFRFDRKRKHGIRFHMARLDRDAATVIEGTIPLFEVEFVGAAVSRFENRALIVRYQYSFLNNGRVETGILAGLATYEFGLAVGAGIRIEDDPVIGDFYGDAGVIAPAPTFGFFTNYGLARNLILEIEYSFLDFDLAGNAGGISNGFMGLTWYPIRHFGIGLGIAGTQIQFEGTSGDDFIKLDYRQTDSTVFLVYAF